MSAPLQISAGRAVSRIDHGPVQVLHGDVLDALELLADESQQCITTSPPFWGVRDYGVAPTRWPEIIYTPMSGAAPIVVPAEAAVLGLEATLEAFVAHTVHVFRALRRVLRADGTAWVEFGDGYDCGTNADRGASKSRGSARAKKVSGWTDRCQGTRRTAGLKAKDLLGAPWRVAFALQADGWWLRGDHVWSRPNPMPESITDRPTRSHSFVFLLAKSAKYFYDAAAISERVAHPEANTADDHARAFSRRRAAAPEVRQKPYKSGNAQRRYGTDRGVPDNTGRERRAGSIPWTDTTGRKNARSVWTIPTQPFKGAHFATWPEEIAEKMILAGTSAWGACARCGAPWHRREVLTLATRVDARPFGRFVVPSRRLGRREVRLLRLLVTPVDAGVAAWRPGCTCRAPAVPCRVLDPFGGSGTSGQVGARHGREVTLIEAQARYLPLIAARVGAVAAQGQLRGIQ